MLKKSKIDLSFQSRNMKTYSKIFIMNKLIYKFFRTLTLEVLNNIYRLIVGNNKYPLKQDNDKFYSHDEGYLIA